MRISFNIRSDPKRLVGGVLARLVCGYLLMDDPWRIALTSDHPNGGAFYHYPEIIYLLMDRNLCAEHLDRMPKRTVMTLGRGTPPDENRECRRFDSPVSGDFLSNP